MLAQLDSWALNKGAREVCLGISNAIDAEEVARTGRFYERLGYSWVGGVYKKALDGCV